LRRDVCSMVDASDAVFEVCDCDMVSDGKIVLVVGVIET
jgi:hypothetical protein